MSKLLFFNLTISRKISILCHAKRSQCTKGIRPLFSGRLCLVHGASRVTPSSKNRHHSSSTFSSCLPSDAPFDEFVLPSHHFISFQYLFQHPQPPLHLSPFHFHLSTFHFHLSPLTFPLSPFTSHHSPPHAHALGKRISLIVSDAKHIHPFRQARHADFIRALHGFHQLAEGVVNLNFICFAASDADDVICGVGRKGDRRLSQMLFLPRCETAFSVVIEHQKY